MRTLTLLPITILLNQFGEPSLLTGIVFGLIVLISIILDAQDVVEWVS